MYSGSVGGEGRVAWGETGILSIFRLNPPPFLLFTPLDWSVRGFLDRHPPKTQEGEMQVLSFFFPLPPSFFLSA